MRTVYVMLAALIAAVLIVGCVPRQTYVEPKPAPEPAPVMAPEPAPMPAFDNYSDLIEGEDPDPGELEGFSDVELIVP